MPARGPAAPPAALAPAAVLALLLAGCLAPAAPPAPVRGDAEGLALLDAYLDPDHDHADLADHPGAAWRMRDVWAEYVPLQGFTKAPPSEFVLHGDLAFVSTFQPFGGFVLLDVSDPERPLQVGAYNAGSAYVNDVEVSPDGRWAFLPTQPYYGPADALDGGLPLVGDYGVQVVDVSDPAQPRLAAVYATPDPAGFHRLDLEPIAGALHVAAAGYGHGRVEVLRFDEAPVPRLTLVSTYQDPRATLEPRGGGPDSYGVHDVTLDPDPLEGFPLLAVAHWRAGAHFVDLSDPARPRALGHWDDFVDVLPGNVHNVEFTAIEGRRIAVAVPEYPGGHERQGILWILDVTDFAAPRLHGTWSLPGDKPVANGVYVYTTDRVLLRNGTAFVAHFHAGAIVLDLDTLEKAADPLVLGFVVPPATEPMRYMGFTTNPLVYDAVPRGEHLFYTDLTGKFHVARMDPEVVRGKTW